LDIRKALLLLKYGLYQPEALRAYRQFQRNQHLAPEELGELNWRKRQRLVRYALEKVPFYRKRYGDAGISAADIARPEDFHRLPLLTKADLRENFDELVSPDARPRHLRLSTTGGSTGVPVKVYHDERFPEVAIGWRALEWWGLSPGVNAAFAWRRMRKGWAKQAINDAIWWPTRRIFLDAASMNEQAVDELLEAFNRLKPPLLQGYVGAIEHLALCVRERGMKVHSPQAVWVTSAPVSAAQRRLISEAFGAPVYDQYGCCEVSWLAAECGAHHGLHINYDCRHVEFLDDEGRPCLPGTLGNVVITDLENFAFPLIRYVPGDLGRALNERCPCGITLPLMDAVKGRITDIIKLPNGTRIAGDFLTTIFDGFPDAVDGFQVRQHKDYSITIYVVPAKGDPGVQGTLKSVRDELARNVGGQVPVTMEEVARIDSDRGKTRFVISDVQ
jgi:phenylacetate-CoA ligase